MWDLNVINLRNNGLAAGLTATEINFLAENKIYPVVGYKISAASIERINKFKDEQENNHGCRAE